MTDAIALFRRHVAWYELLCWTVVAAFLVYFIFCFAFVAFAAFRYPHARDYGEGVVLDQVRQLAEGRALYTDPVETRRVCTYPPVYHLLAMPWTDPDHPAFLPGRLISVLAMLGTSVMMGLMVWEVSRRRAAAVLGAGLVFAFPYPQNWGVFYRVDMTGIFFTTVGLWWAIRFRKTRWVYLSALWFLLVGYTRHSLIAAPAAVAVSLFAVKRRRGVRFAAILIAAAAVVFLTIDLLTHHQFFTNVITGNSLAVKATGGFSNWTKRFFRWYAVTSVLALLYVPMGMRLRRWNMLAVYAVAALLMTLPEKRGAYTNYLIEFTVASAGAASAAAVLLVSKARRKSLVSCVLALLIAVQCFGVAWFKDIHPSPIDPRKLGRESRVIAAVRAIPGPVIAQDVSYVVLAGKEMQYQPLVMTQLSREGLWDQAPFVRDIRLGRFAGILLDTPLERHKPGFLFTVEQIEAMKESYKLKQSWPSNPEGTRGKFLYVPNANRNVPNDGN